MHIAKSRLYGERRGIRRKAIQFAIGTPVADAHGDVSCTVHIGGIDPPRKIFGIDSLQALALSINFLGQRLESLQSSGWRFYFTRQDSESFDPKSIWFPETGHPPRKGPTSRSTRSRAKTRALG
jgi:hypothetical protein